MKAIARILLLTLVPLEAVWAVDKSFSKVLHQIQFDSSGGGTSGWDRWSQAQWCSLSA